MDNLAKIDTNILFKRIKNQFLAAIIGIIILVIFNISYVISSGVGINIISIAISALVLILFITAFMVNKLNKSTHELQKIDNNVKKNTTNASQKLWRMIVGFGEECLRNEIPDNQRVFASDALSTVIGSVVEDLEDHEVLLKTILKEIKSASDSEIKQKKAFSEVLKKRSNI